MRLGALEAGGTKMVLAVFDERLNELAHETLPTTIPEETIPQMVSFFKQHAVDALGIATFGPVNLRASSPTFGTILNTPKLAWQQVPLLQQFQEALSIPCGIDTDVNAAALAEAELGAAKGLKNCLYFTVGTGIGGGVFAEGKLIHGLMHPEWGHVLLTRHEEDPLLVGVCPYHPNCVEGFASGPSMQTRWGMPAKDLPADHRGWEIEAHYLGQLCANALMSVSPEVILLGGGVMHQQELLPLVRKTMLKLVNGYIDAGQLPPMEDYIKAPQLWPDSGLIGAALLAKKAFENAHVLN